jgi:hypothetical protein
MRIETNPQTCAAIKLQDQFDLGLGEWFLDASQGVPYVHQILGVKNPNINAIRALFREIILGTPGIVALNELQVVYNARTRRLFYSFAAVDNTGAIIEGGDSPFVVS